MLTIYEGDGLRAGSDAAIRVRFVDGDGGRNLADYTVTARAKIDTGAEFDPVCGAVDDINGLYNLSFTAAQLDAAGTLTIEFDFAPTGSASPISPPAQPLLIPVRADYQSAAL